MSSRKAEKPSRGGTGADGFVKDLLPSGPRVTVEDVRTAGLALCRLAVRDAGLPYAPSRARLSDLTVDQGNALSVALQALGVKESPEPQWYQDPILRNRRRTATTEDVPNA